MLSQAFHTPCRWESFTPDHAADLLRDNRGLLVVGDAHQLDPALYGKPDAWHAFNLTDCRTGADGQTWFKGLDSNVAGQEKWWPAEAVRRALERGREQFGSNMLVTDGPVEWPWKNT